MPKSGLSRREFLQLQLGGAAWLALGGHSGFGCSKSGKESATRIIALGLDGMDPKIVNRMMRAGLLPAFSRLAREGHFSALGTSNPPQSPVAWSNFITGCNPGGHGIFDFIHRNPKNYLPYLSTSRTESAATTFTIGDYVIPVSSGSVKNLRQGRAFWDIMADYEIPATIFKMPSNFPPSSESQRTISGMGTPDILGTYGIYSYYTDNPEGLESDLGGGRIEKVAFVDHGCRASLTGPRNTYRVGKPKSKIEFKIFRDPQHPTAKVALPDQEIFLNQGEWSPWVKVTFHLAPLVSVCGICKFYLKQVHPDFKLYVSPIHIDPSDPAMPISSPESYAQELYEQIGPFHTKGLPADTKALDHGVLDESEFLALDDVFLEEKLATFEYELARFDSGLLFFYISNTDQRSHMFWRLMDQEHPLFDARLASTFGSAIEDIYVKMDRLVAKALSKVDRNTLLLVFSDHGFAPYYRSFHLNSWLQDLGYLTLDFGADSDAGLMHVDWSGTRAYALGFNGLYINQQGREGQGIVSSAEKDSLIDEICTRLEETVDSESGARPILKAHRSRQVYSGAYKNSAPDIIVGYNRGYRASWQTALGEIPDEIVSLNQKKWSGDHCVSPGLVPGILLANKKLLRDKNIHLHDLTATILKVFGIPVPDGMNGQTVL